jgi:hypothetical protein
MKCKDLMFTDVLFLIFHKKGEIFKIGQEIKKDIPSFRMYYFISDSQISDRV